MESSKLTLDREDGRYLYGVADSGDTVSLGKIGLEGNEVYTIPFRDLCAVVHDCPAEPYKSDDQERVQAWVLAHQRVVETVWERWGVVLPSGFDTILRGGAEADVGQYVRRWLEEEYEGLKQKIEHLRGKAEYGVQVFWDPEVIARNVAETSPEIKSLEEEIRAKPRGLAYMYRQRLESLLKKEMEAKADRYFKEWYSQMRRHTDDLRVEKIKKAEHGRQMIMNLSCLVPSEAYTELGEELDRISQMDGISVRFTGPWPPYSFLGGV
ncbi:MAG: GvpL/GvpF family gas vesicle protein [Chloroflexi bacterium]|nr:GvpL/GvpF family gas vesicle protein [Chloroflexota bacterium]